MGAFYGSIHFRTADRAAVRRVLESVGGHHLLAPPANGWVTAYPEDNGQSADPAAAAAQLFPGPVIWVMVHDDDIFAYHLYRGGELADRYDSAPDYFEDVDETERDATRGRPERYADLLAPGRTVEEVAAVLAHARRPITDRAADPASLDTLATTHLQRFAELLALPAVCNAYEYLLDGEDDDFPAGALEQVPAGGVITGGRGTLD